MSLLCSLGVPFYSQLKILLYALAFVIAIAQIMLGTRMTLPSSQFEPFEGLLVVNGDTFSIEIVYTKLILLLWCSSSIPGLIQR